MARGLKFWIYEVEGLYYLCSKNKGADQLHGNSFAVTVKLISVFVFAYAKCWFSRDVARMYMSHIIMRKSAFCICENKGADQLHGNRTADQRLCFRYIHVVQSLYFLNPKFPASSHLLWSYSPVYVRPG